MNNVTTTEIIAYNEFRAQLSELREYNEKAVFDYASPKGSRDARSHIYKLRKTRAAVDACRKAEKAASLAYGRKVDAEAKDIIGELEQMIQVHQAPLDEIKALEEARIASIMEAIGRLESYGRDLDGMSFSELSSRLEYLNGESVSEGRFQEFLEQATHAHAIAKSVLTDKIRKQKQYEEELAELERLREEKAERARKEAEARRAREAKERDERIAKEAAARAKLEADDKARREKDAAARRERELKEEAERARKEKEDALLRAERAAQQAREKVQREAEQKKERERKAQAKRESDRKHRQKIDTAASGALIELAHLTEEQAENVVVLIASRSIPHVTISY